MWYLKVSPDLFIAVALICMIQNAISIPLDSSATEDRWDMLAKSTEYKDLKKLSGKCKKSINNFNEKLENMKTSTNTKLSESNKTTADIVSLAKDVKSQVKSASNNIVSIRMMVQKMALRFRDTFKSLESFSDIDHEHIYEKLKDIEKTTVDYKKPVVRNAIKSFGNKYDLDELANKILKITSDDENLKDSYDGKRKIAKQEFSLLWNTLKRHSKTINNDALETLNIFINGVDSVKTIKNQAKNYEEDALNEEKGGEHIKNMKDAVELAKAFKLKFKDEFELGSGEMTYSQEEKNEFKNDLNEEQPDDILNNSEPQTSDDDLKNSLNPEEIDSRETNNDIDTTQPNSQDVKQDPTDNSSNFNIMNTPVEQKLPNVENKDNDKLNNIQPKNQIIQQDPIDNNSNSDILNTTIEQKLPNVENKDNDDVNIPQPVKSDSSVNNPNSSNEGNLTGQNTPNINDSDEKMVTQLKNQVVEPTSKDDISKSNEQNFPNDKNIEMKQTESPKNQRKTRKIMNKKREKIPILPWTELIKQKDLKVSNQSQTCKNIIQNTLKEFENMRTPMKNAIRNVKNYDELEKSKNNIIQQFSDKMIETSSKFADNLINAADDVCLKVMPMNKRYETKFKNDSNIKRIEYLLSKNYDPNQYIINVLKNTKTTSDEPQKETYNKMLSISYNLKNEMKEIDKAALYAMNKINEGKLAVTDLKQMFNKEKASKACYIQKMLQEKENEEEKKQKEDIKNKLNEYMKEKTQNKQIDANSNLDLVEATHTYPVEDADEPQIIDDDDELTKSSETDDDKNNSHSEIIEAPMLQENEPQSTNNMAPMKNLTKGPQELKTHEEADEEQKAKPEISKETNVGRDLPKNVIPENEHDTSNEPKESKEDSTAEDQNPDISANPNVDDKTPIDKKPVRRVRKVKKPKVGDEETVEEFVSEEVPNEESNDSGIHEEDDKTPTAEIETPKETTVVRDLPENVNHDNVHDTSNESKEPEGDSISEDQDPNIIANPNIENKTAMDKKPVRRVRKVKKPKVGDEETVEYEESEEVPDEESNDKGIHENDVETPISESEIAKETPMVRDLPDTINPDTEHDTSNESKEPEGDSITEDQDPNIVANPNVDDKTPMDKKPVRRVRKVKKPKVGDEETVEYEESEEVPDEESNDKGIHEDDVKTPISESEIPKETPMVKDLPDTVNPDTEHDTSNESKEPEGDSISEDQDPNIIANPNVEDKTSMDKKPVRRVRKVKKPKVGDEETVEYEESEEVPDEESNDKGIHEDDVKTPISESEIPKETPMIRDLPDTINPDTEHDTSNESKEPEGDSITEDQDPNIVANPNVDDKTPMDKKPVRRVRKVKKPKVGDEETVEYEESEEVPDEESNDKGIHEDDVKTPISESEIPKESPMIRDLPDTINPDTEHDTSNESKEPEGDSITEDQDPNIVANPNVDDKTPMDKKPVRRVRKVKKPKVGDEETVEYEESEEVPDEESNDKGIHEDDVKTPISESEIPKESPMIRDLPDTLNPDTEHDTSNESKEPEGDSISEDQNPNIITNPNIEDKTAMDKKPVRRVRKVKKPKVGDEETVEYDESEEVPDEESNDKGIHEDDVETPISESEIPKETPMVRDLPDTVNPDTEHDTSNESKKSEGDSITEDQDPSIITNPIIEDKTAMDKKPVRRVRKVKKPKVGDEETVEYDESEEVPDEESNDKGIHEDDVKTPISESEIPKETPMVRDLPDTVNPDTEHDTSNESKEPEGDSITEDQDPNIVANPNVDDKTPMDKKPVRRVRKVKKPKVGDEETVEYEESEEVPDEESNDKGIHENDVKTPISESEIPKKTPMVRDLPDTVNPDTEHDTSNESKEPEGDSISEDQVPNIIANPNVDDKTAMDKKPVRRVRKVKKPKVGDEETVEYDESEEVPDEESNDKGIHEDDVKTPISESEIPKETPMVRDLPDTVNPDTEHDTSNESKESDGDSTTEDQDPNIIANTNVDDKTTMDKKPVRRVRKVKKPKVGDEETVEYEESEEVPDEESNDKGIHEDDVETPISESKIPKNTTVVRDLPDTINPDTEHDTSNEPKESDGDSTTEDQDPNIVANPNVDDKTPMDKKPVRRVRKVKKPKVGDEGTVEYEESEEVPGGESDISESYNEAEKDPKIELESPNVDDKISTKKKHHWFIPNWHLKNVMKPKETDDELEKNGNMDEVFDDKVNDSRLLEEDDENEISKSEIPMDNDVSENLSLADDSDFESTDAHPNPDNKSSQKNKPVRRFMGDNKSDELQDVSEEYDETNEIFDDDADQSKLPEESVGKLNIDPQILNESNFPRDLSEADNLGIAADDINDPKLSEVDSTSDDSDPNISTITKSGDKIPQKNKPVKRAKNRIEPDKDDDISEEYKETNEVFDENFGNSDVSKVSDELPNSEENIPDSSVNPITYKWSEDESLPNASDNQDESFDHDVKNTPHVSDEYKNDDSGTIQETPDDYGYENDDDSNDNITNDNLPSEPHNIDEEPNDSNDKNIPYDDHEDVQERDSNKLQEYSQPNDMEPSEESEYPEISDLSSENELHPHGIYRQGKPVDPTQRKNKRKPRFTRKPKNGNKEPNESKINEDIDDVESDIQDQNDENLPDDDGEKLQENDTTEPLESLDTNEMEYDREPDLPDETESPSEFEPSYNDEDELYDNDNGEKENLKTDKGKKYKKKKFIRRKKTTTSNNTNKKRSITEENISETLQKKKNNKENEDYSPENLEEENSKNIKPKQKKKKRVKRVKRYLVNKATNEKILIDDDMDANQRPTYSENPKFFDGENEPEDSNLDDFNKEKDNNDYSEFLFNENNADQCKREAYDKFKKVKSEDTKEIAYRSILDTSEMRSNVLITMKNAIKNVKYAQTSKDVDQNLGTVSYVLKTGLKQTILDLMEKVLPLVNDFLQTTKSLKELYVKGPPTTYKMLTSVLQSEPNIPSINNGLLRFISPKFNVDELIDGLFKEPLYTKPLKSKKAKAQRKFMELSKNMETAVSNIDCYVLSAMSTIGIGSNALQSLKSGRVIMSEKHPRTTALRDALGVVKALQKVLENSEFTPKINNEKTIETKDDDYDDDDEDPEQVAKKNEEFLKTVPTLDDNVTLFKKMPNQRRSLGVIVVHPNKEVEYKEITDTSELKKFVGDRTNRYTNQSQDNRPKFLKVDKKKLIDKIVADVRKKADKNGMSKKEMVDEIINTLKKK